MKLTNKFALSLITVAIGLSLSPAGLPGMSAALAQSQPPAAGTDTLRAEMFKLSKPLQEALAAKDYPAALAIVAQIDAMPNKTAYESYYADTARASIAQATGDKLMTVQAYEKLVASGRLSPSDQVKTIQQLGVRYYDLKNYPQASLWLARALKEGGEDRELRMLLIQSHYLTNDFATSSSELRAVIAADEKAGVKPTEPTLQLFASAIMNLKDKPAYTEVLEKYVTYYPKKEYWTDLLHRVETKPGFSERLSVDVYRLQFATGSMSTANEYVEMAQMLIAAGFPGEAKKIIDQGYSSGAMGGGSASDIAVQKKLRDQATKSAAEDLKNLAAGEADANKPGRDGNGLSNLGFALVQAGQFDKGLAMMERGQAKGLGKRAEEGKLHYAIAQALAGRKDDAIKTFATVGGTEGTADLARYWIVYLKTASGSVAAK